MYLIIFFFGTMWGFLITCIIAAIALRYQSPIQRKVHELMNHSILTSGNNAYIAGLSDEEQSFADSINKNVDVKLD